MKTRVLFIVLTIISFLQVAEKVSAQDEDFKNSTPEERAKFQTEWMKSELSLDSSIIPAVYNVNLKYSKKTQVIMNSGGSRLQKYKEYKSVSSAKDNELKSLLTKEQYKLYEQKKEEMRQKMREKIQERRNHSGSR